MPDMQSLGIVLMCVAAAVLYGIAHDQITARVCVEYFTIPPSSPPQILPCWASAGEFLRRGGLECFSLCR